MTYIKSMKNEECNKTLVRMFKKINIDKINTFIDSIDCMSHARRNFYKRLISFRYEILKEVFNKISLNII